MSLVNTTDATEADLEVLRDQLGRVPRGVVGIAARCVCGRPTVVATAPRLPDGTPFPTTYYLTHPAAVKGASTLEAEHVMETLNWNSPPTRSCELLTRAPTRPTSTRA